jgi:peptide/nickel transport system permease protein
LVATCSAQLLAGARIAFMVGLSSAFMSIVPGNRHRHAGRLPAGRVADTLLMRLADMIMVMPTLLVVLILSALFGQLNIWTIVLSLPCSGGPACPG